MPKPASHAVSTQVPELQDSEAFARLHALPHAPQWVVVFRGDSQPLFGFPSQLSYPEEQVIVQTPFTHAAVPYGLAQTLPQLPQLFRSVSVLTSHPLATLASQLE